MLDIPYSATHQSYLHQCHLVTNTDSSHYSSYGYPEHPQADSSQTHHSFVENITLPHLPAPLQHESGSPINLKYTCSPSSEPPNSLFDEHSSSSLSPEASLSPSPVLSSKFHSNFYAPYLNGKLTVVREAERHTIFPVETGEDEYIRKTIHHLTELEKQSLSWNGYTYHTERPNFFCKMNGCYQPWIYNRTRIKEHLSRHNITFGKPWECCCGSQFSRRVEATRHLEDLIPCKNCGGSGRKVKRYRREVICYRCQKKERKGV